MSTPYLTTTATTDLIRGDTFFQVANVTGIEKGDLISITSPVVITSAAKLTQTYLVQGIDVTNKYIYVMGYIAGDIRADQITAQNLTGNITVKCYKVANSIKIKNGKVTSLNQDAETSMVYFEGFRYVNITELTPEKPNRTAVNIGSCGIVNIDKCFSVDVGYVENDQGYNSIPSNPLGLGYGYGFLITNSYCVNFFNNNVLAGWHGLDVAVGVTFANAFGNTLHKGAFGVSSHEGQWCLNFYGNTVLGGHAVTCRSFELTFEDNIARGIKNRFIIGGRNMQSLIIANNDIEISKAYTGNFIYFDGVRDKNCFSNDEPVAKISGNKVRNLVGVSSRILVAKNLDIDGNDFGFGEGANLTFGALDATGVLNIRNNKHSGIVQQSVYSIIEPFAEINIQDEDDKTIPTLSNSSLLSLSVAAPKVNLLDNKVRNKGVIIRALNNYVVNYNNIIGNKVFDGDVLGWNASNSTVQNFIGNLTKTAIPSTNLVNYINRLDNRVLDRAYSASKTHDWGSLAAGAVQQTTLGLVNTPVGTPVIANMSIPLNGTQIWAELTATDIITVYHRNPTATAVDLPSGILTVKIL